MVHLLTSIKISFFDSFSYQAFHDLLNNKMREACAMRIFLIRFSLLRVKSMHLSRNNLTKKDNPRLYYEIHVKEI